MSFQVSGIENTRVAPAPKPSPHSSRAHVPQNMPSEPLIYNAFECDPLLASMLQRSGAGWAQPMLSKLGSLIGSLELQELARAANQNLPVLHTHDRFGRRLDRVEYHPSYHELMRLSYKSQVHSLPWVDKRPMSQVARAAISYLWNEGENGIACPNVMSYSIVPLLRANPEIGKHWEPGILSSDYDPRHIPSGLKTGLHVAMSMTEKQGGSDLRQNDTRAQPTGNSLEYCLRGHKFFCSVPMADVILLTARTESGISLFLAPRLLPDGSHNGIYIQRLKDKVGNRSNASSEIEIDGTIAYRLGEEGHGIREFIRHMTHYIRMDFAIAAAGIMRRALTLAVHHVRHRRAFGDWLVDQPQMRNVLADLAIEWEAALLLGMRMATAVDKQGHSEDERLLLRVGVPVAKYWNCKRVNHFALEALECHGGMGFVEEQPIARLFREAPLNSIWEGTASMMGLDFVRSICTSRGTRDALMREIRMGASGDRLLKRHIAELGAALERAPEDLERSARYLMSKTALCLQASLLHRNSTAEVAEAFVNARLGHDATFEFGTLATEAQVLGSILRRAVPHEGSASNEASDAGTLLQTQQKLASG